MRRILVAACAVSVTALCSVGCDRVGGAHEPSIGPVPHVRNSADLARLTLPLDRYQVDTDKFAGTFNRAWDTLVARCLSDFGLGWTVADPDDKVSVTIQGRRYGIMDERDAQKYGYRSRDLVAAAKKPPPPEPDAETAAVLGGSVSNYKGRKVPSGGCAGAANRRLSVDGRNHAEAPPPLALPRRLSAAALELSENDSRVQKAFALWSRCMRSAGFSYQSPWDANDDPKWGQTEEPNSAEIATATADVACRAKTNVVGTWYAVDAAYQRRALRDHRVELERIKALAMAEYRRAKDVLNE